MGAKSLALSRKRGLVDYVESRIVSLFRIAKLFDMVLADIGQPIRPHKA